MRGDRLTHSGGPTVLIEAERLRLLTEPTSQGSVDFGGQVRETAFPVSVCPVSAGVGTRQIRFLAVDAEPRCRLGRTRSRRHRRPD
jgi:hypothetical protein